MSDLRTHDVSAGMNLQTEGASGLSETLRARGIQADVAKPAQKVDLTSCGRR